MAVRNIAAVSSGDHLLCGVGDGRLAGWRDELGAGLMHWRALKTRLPGRCATADGGELG